MKYLIHQETPSTIFEIGNVYKPIFHSNKSYKKFVYSCDASKFESSLAIIRKEVNWILKDLPNYKQMTIQELERVLNALSICKCIKQSMELSEVDKWIEKISVYYFSQVES